MKLGQELSLVLEREQDSLGGGYRGSQFLLSHLKKKFKWTVVSFIPERSEGSQRLTLQG